MRNMTFSGNENIDYSPSTKKTFGSRKVFLLIMAILAAVSDFALLVVFAISGHGGLAVPIILLILDGLFIAGVCLSNFRFKYAIVIWSVYLAVSVIVTSFLATLEIGATYMTDAAKTLNVFAHIALYLVTIFASIYPIIKSNTKIKAIMVTAVTIAVILVGAFAVYFSANGYFGQGFLGEYRVVGYTLDEASDTYIATDIKAGRSDKVIIPEEFNGKKVSGVNCAIFTYTSIKSVEIQSKEEIDFVENQYLSSINQYLKIGVDKKYIDVYREDFLNPDFPPEDPGMRLLANCFYPTNLEKDERYITFEYNEYPYVYDTYPYTKDVIPTWIGKAGQEFKLDYSDKAEYMRHTSASDSADLVWCYDNNNAKILTGSMVNLVGKTIDSDKYRVEVDFADVYRVKIEEDNDTVYEPADSFKTTVVDGKVYDYLYFTIDRAYSTLDGLSFDLIEDRDNGFALSWEYKLNIKSNFGSDYWHSLGDMIVELYELSQYRGNAVDIKLRPVWTMKDPTDLKITFDNNNYVYGDNIVMTFSGKAPNDDCVMHLEWDYVGSGTFEENTSDKYYIYNALPQYGTYGVYVTVTSDKSSLSSVGYVERDLKVDKRPLHITWQEPSDMVYNAQEKVLQHFVKEDDLINGDVLANYISEYDIRNINAGDYTARISLIGDIYDKYTIAYGASHSYTIAPRPTQAQWTCEDFTYDGYPHNAQATAEDLYGGTLSVTLSGAKVNAGTYTAVATSDDSNYTLTNHTFNFDIKQKSVTVSKWTIGPSFAKLKYTGYAQYPTVLQIDGLVRNDYINNQLIYSGYSTNIDAGEGYTVKVELPASSNYKFDSQQSTTYNIEKKSLSVRVLASDKVYDGKVNSFDIDVVGLVDIHNKSSLGTPSYGGSGAGAVDAGNYSVNVSLPNNNVTKNYDITYVATNFSITKAQVEVSWSGVVVKDGVVVAPEASITVAYPNDVVMGNYVYRDSYGRVISSIPYESGTYSVEINPTSKNYIFTNTRINFTVTIDKVQNREVA
ncbi:MAG: hypothetical protein K2L70_01055 [Clostridia bacterium]|nr:hypothetical protein [Clostridia bacterium]